MGEPDLTGQQASRETEKCSGDYIADEMPVTADQQHCRNEQKRG